MELVRYGSSDNMTSALISTSGTTHKAVATRTGHHSESQRIHEAVKRRRKSPHRLGSFLRIAQGYGQHLPVLVGCWKTALSFARSANRHDRHNPVLRILR